jgi:predicted flap endonuclease-1-like 5' DNA nuclease
MAKIEEIEGIGPAYAEKLALAGVKTPEELLDQGASAAGRKKLCESTGISSSLILRWVNHADLFRITGIGPQYAELLEAAGVDSVAELAQRVPANLHAKLVEVQEQKNLTGRAPAESFVVDWVEQAKQLPKRVTH